MLYGIYNDILIKKYFVKLIYVCNFLNFIMELILYRYEDINEV